MSRETGVDRIIETLETFTGLGADVTFLARVSGDRECMARVVLHDPEGSRVEPRAFTLCQSSTRALLQALRILSEDPELMTSTPARVVRE